MFTMSMSTVSVALLIALMSPAQEPPSVAGDDWEFHEDAARGMVAMARYSGGQSVIVQCKGGALNVLLVGLPVTGGGPRDFEAQRADGRRDRQSWRPGEAPNVLTATVIGRTVRFLRRGGDYSLALTEPGAPPVRVSFDMPTSFENLDRVIAACDWPLEDERDRLDQAEPGAFEWARTGGRRQGPREGEGTLIGVSHHSCIIRGLRLSDCRVDHQLPRNSSDGARAARDLEGTRLSASDPAQVEGRVVYLSTSTSRFAVRTQ